MIKLPKFLLPFCIFLAYGFVQHGTSSHPFFLNSASRNLAGIAHHNFISAGNDHGWMISSIPTDREKNAGVSHLFDIEENKVSFDRIIFGSHGNLHAMSRPIISFFIPYIHKGTFPFDHFYRFPSYKSLFPLWVVMRI
jgi:hypothetical protein